MAEGRTQKISMGWAYVCCLTGGIDTVTRHHLTYVFSISPLTKAVLGRASRIPPLSGNDEGGVISYWCMDV